MPVTAKQKTVLAIVLTAVVAIAPSFFGYLQARQEIREKYQLNRSEASNGYDALVTSIKDLQATVTKQHDYITKLQGQVALLAEVISSAGSGLRMSGSGAGSASSPPELPPPLEPLPRLPPMPAPPADFNTAQMQMR
jgi:hypothetical protein